MPADAARFGPTAYTHPFRRYQQLALDAFEAARAAGQKRVYVVLPPGAGKTVLGLEIARRLGRPSLVLAPNSAVQAQWLRQWRDFQPGVIEASPAPTLTSAITVLTYQALCVLDPDQDEVETAAVALWQQTLEQRDGLPEDQAALTLAQLRAASERRFSENLAAYKRRVRRLVTAGGSRQEVLQLLHPNGQQLVERAKAILEVNRGLSPFDTTSELRILWQ